MARIASHRLEQAKAALLAELRLEVRDRRLLEAMSRVPRERFVPPEVQPYAYDNRPLPIGYGQTISQPLIVAVMTEALGLRGSEKVLEIGTGSGYQAAIVAELAAEVVTVERVAPLAERASLVLADLGYRNVHVHAVGDELGWPEEAPYDAILVTAGAPGVPRELVDQLAGGGRMVVPVGGRDLQDLLRVTRRATGISVERLGPCRFVPLVGRGAWPDGAEPSS
ncbi:MAG: protein-L-isoaspartate(D-aspartate) O-methyltransferase [Chloroflexi bacterium]|nr:protein-L-isoaspartate(D-aspartate) O-methyltransferase [Chloroflexota bacterium]